MDWGSGFGSGSLKGQERSAMRAGAPCAAASGRGAGGGLARARALKSTFKLKYRGRVTAA